MDLLLWRHAHALDAQPGQPDMERPLSKKGVQQAKAMAVWLNKHLPSETAIFVSPSQRTMQTVAHLDRPYTLSESIRPDAQADDVLTLAGWPFQSTSTVLVVAHQPFLSDTVAKCLALPTDHGLSFRKGAVWWLRHRLSDGHSHAFLWAVMDPQLLNSRF